MLRRPSKRIVLTSISILLLVAFFAPRYLMPNDAGKAPLTVGDGKTLVVLAPPLDGERGIPDLKRLVRSAYPTADMVIPTYANWWLSNADPFEMVDVLEESIRKAHDTRHYERIVVFGYSLGGVIARKAFVWGHGLEEDRDERVRAGLVRRGKHEWVDKVERFVSLAAPNRGWRSDGPAGQAPFYVTWAAIGMEEVGRLTGTGYLLRSVLAGSPFIADLRVQWIRLARAKKSTMPLVVHLVGKRDELVSREDSLDLNAAEGVIFKTLPAVNHREISQQLFLTENGQQALSEVGHAIQEALVLNRPQFPAGWADPVTRTQDEAVTRVVYIMHGIRDEGDWTDVIENRILRLLGGDIQTIKIPPVRYNRFAMLPFLLYWDRQRNVRRFMDQYTEDLARYPNLKTVDYFGHSNGTYIVASALQQYPVLEVRNVLFAGSVVPSHYSWARPLAERRVQQVRNVVADADWVVGLFPQVFELFSQHVLREEHSGFGLFDVGAAGFRGFKEANDGGSVKDIRFVAGQHSAAIEVVGTEPLAVRKLEAIATFMATGDDTQLSVFDMTKTRDPYVYFLSNFSWAVWLIIVLAIAGFGWLAASRSPLILGGYVALLLVVLFTV